MTRDEVIKALETCTRARVVGYRCTSCPLVSVKRCINTLEKAALALLKAEPKRGRWIDETDRERHWHCSVCGYTAGIAAKTYKYCPGCGAKMERDDVDEVR